uniref:Secreted protein n=1 Tax=Steinernema glaseri TaxID=37863 RepID=A0A1I7Z8K1_9BILA
MRNLTHLCTPVIATENHCPYSRVHNKAPRVQRSQSPQNPEDDLRPRIVGFVVIVVQSTQRRTDSATYTLKKSLRTETTFARKRTGDKKRKKGHTKRVVAPEH